VPSGANSAEDVARLRAGVLGSSGSVIEGASSSAGKSANLGFADRKDECQNMRACIIRDSRNAS
jgi:hypothetical protein